MQNFNLSVFIRNLSRNKFYLVITMGGFVLALTFALLLGVYVYQESSIDKFHANKDRIFRMTASDPDGNFFGYFYPNLGDIIKDKHPEIETYTRLYSMNGILDHPNGEKIRARILFADTPFFSMFSYKILEGDKGTMFSALDGVVLSRSYARQLFGDRSPIGNVVEIERLGKKLPFVVSGVVEDFKGITHIDECDMVVSMGMVPSFQGVQSFDQLAGWGSLGLYFLARPGVDLNTKADEIFETLKKNCWAFQRGFIRTLRFQPLETIYFEKVPGKAAHSGDPMMVGILAVIILFVLGLAVINYINLTIAQAGSRAREVAVKKVLGAGNNVLYKQFVGESVLLLGIAFVFALLLSFLLTPAFNGLLGINVDWTAHLTVWSVLGMMAAILLLGGVAGVVPAFVITRFKPVEVVKGVFRVKSKNVYAKALICFQYAVAVVLIVATFVGVKQTDFLRNYDLGFDKENIVWLSSAVQPSQKETLKDELLRIPGVEAVSYVQGSPMDGGNSSAMEFDTRTVDFRELRVDSSFFSMMGLKVEPTGVSSGAWINRTTIKTLGLSDLPDMLRLKGGETIPVRGVVNDFRIRALDRNMECVMLTLMQPEESPWKVLIKIKDVDPAGVYGEIKKFYAGFIDGVPFDSGFMDETLALQYESNERTARLIGYFSVLAIVLAMMGSLAMITYFIRQKVKEIGIRRVNGATIREIWSNLLVDFMKWVVLAFVLACPIAWFALQRWLSEFACRIDLSWWLFPLAGLMVSLIALAVVSGQCWMAARRNPVESLKNE